MIAGDFFPAQETILIVLLAYILDRLDRDQKMVWFTKRTLLSGITGGALVARWSQL
ncbi:MAG TPA: hypothetical protein VOA41_12185 [Candidatus Dormibacteraeota bacterium]|nr:hypothetical protein [Candidatus Dormibacteraeota bacterium]